MLGFATCYNAASLLEKIHRHLCYDMSEQCCSRKIKQWHVGVIKHALISVHNRPHSAVLFIKCFICTDFQCPKLFTVIKMSIWGYCSMYSLL